MNQLTLKYKNEEQTHGQNYPHYSTMHFLLEGSNATKTVRLKSQVFNQSNDLSTTLNTVLGSAPYEYTQLN